MAIPGSQALFAKFEVRQTGTQDLFGKFEVRHAATADLPCRFCAHTDRIAQDFNTWTETDADEDLTHDCNFSYWTTMPRSRLDTHLSIDLGAAGIGEDLIHEFILNVYAVEESPDGNEERMCAWAGLLALDDFYNSNDFEVVALIVLATDTADEYQLQLIEKGGNSQTMATKWVNYQDRYIRIYKLGTEIRAYVYQDAAHTILEDAAKITLSADHNFRFIAAPLSYGAVGAEDSSGSIDFFFGSFRNLYAKFNVQHAASQNLFGKFIVRQSASQNLFAKFEAQDREDLYAKFIIQQAASQNLFCKFVVRQASSQNLFAKFIIRHATSQNLFAKFSVRHAASQNLFSKFAIRKASFQSLFGKFIVRQAASQNLFVKFIVRQAAAQNFFVKFSVRHAASQNLFGKFIIRHGGFANAPYCIFVVRHAASRDLYATFVVRHAASQDLFSKFVVRHPDAENLFAKFIVRHSGSQDLFAKFDVIHWVDLYAKFVIRKYVNSCFILPSGMTWCPDLYCKFSIPYGTVNLFSKFKVQNPGSQNLYAKFNVRHVGIPQNLFCKFKVSHLASENLFAKFICRNVGSQNLFAKFEAQAVEDLYAKFSINQGYANLFAKFWVQSALLPCAEIIVDDDIDAWINYYDCQETGFLDRPWHRNDAVEKVSGVDSYRIQIDPVPERYKTIVFGWNWRAFNSCWGDFYVGGAGSGAALKMVRTNGVVVDLSEALQELVTEAGAEVTFLRFYDGVLWIGTNKGDVISWDGEFTSHTVEVGLLSTDTVYDIVYNGSFYLITSNSKILQAWTPGSPPTDLTDSLQTSLRYLIYNSAQKLWDRADGLAYNSVLDRWMVNIVQKHYALAPTLDYSYYGFPVLFTTDGATITPEVAARQHISQSYALDTSPDVNYFLVAGRRFSGDGDIFKYTARDAFSTILNESNWPVAIDMQFYRYQLLAVRASEDYPLWRRHQEDTPTNFSDQTVTDAKAVAQCRLWAMLGGGTKLVSLNKERGTFRDHSAAAAFTEINAIAALRDWRYS